MVLLAARSVAKPIIGLRRAMATITDGDLNVEVDVDDGSELGLLHAGFNELVAGLRERERLRDLFGRHVGEDVARRAEESGVELGGEPARWRSCSSTWSGRRPSRRSGRRRRSWSC